MSYTNLNTADALEWGEVQLGAGGGAQLLDGDTMGAAEADLRVGLTGWMDGGLKVEALGLPGQGAYLNLVMLDAKFQYLDEEQYWLSAAVQPAVGVGFFGDDFMGSLLFSKKFGRWEPVFAYRFQYLVLPRIEDDEDEDEQDGDNEDGEDEDDEDRDVLFPGATATLSDLFVGVRIETFDWLYIFPEVGVSISHATGHPMYHGNLGVQFLIN